jgi:hypothetical protein
MPGTWSNRFLRCGVAALAALSCLTAVQTRSAYAATTTTISDAASCTAFGGSWDTNEDLCDVMRTVTIAAGDTLQVQTPVDFEDIINNGTFTTSGRAWVATGAITNNAAAVINANGSVLRTYGASTNYGTINGHMQTARPFTNAPTGKMNMSGELFLADVLTNNGTITFSCGAYLSTIYNASIVGNQPKDACPPSVTINQAAGQADPANSGPVQFTASFNEPVSGLVPGNVTLSGTADLSGAKISVSGGPSTYTISVTGVKGNGTVKASLAADMAKDAGDNGNTVSTSTDNTVTYDSTAPADSRAINGTHGSNDWYTSDVKVDWNWTDSGTGLDSAHCTQTSSSSSDGDAVKLSANCQDLAGNTSGDSLTVKVDRTPPSLRCESPAPVIPLGASGTISASVSDATSGPERPQVSAVADTTTTGAKTKSLTGTDNAGNATTVSCAYTVAAAPQPAAPAKPTDTSPAPVVAPVAGGCMANVLRLVDVRVSGRHVLLVGETSKANAGRDVTLLFAGRAVTTARVQPDGSFRTTAPLPALRLRGSAGYTAVLGSLRSPAVKLNRRIQLTGISSRAGTVTIVGHVSRPLANPVRTVTLRQYGDCHGQRLVKVRRGIRVSAAGDFRVTVPAPAGSVASYRAFTQVREPGSSRVVPTSSLLRGVTLAH